MFRIASIFVILFLSQQAWARTARLYNLRTGDVVELKYSSWSGSHGKISGHLKSGENLKGEYSTVVDAAVAWGSIYSSVYGPRGAAYGNANSTSVVTGGKNEGSAILTGDQGTILECEYISSFGHGSGACKDNHDNKYKLMF